jgi:hypothetical protein
LNLVLTDFSEQQVQDLNERYGAPLKPNEIPLAMDLLGGHPYLIRQALYTLVCEEWAWPALEVAADEENGPFGDHLRYHLRLLLQDPELMEAVRKIAAEKTCPDDVTLRHRLSCSHLIRIQGDRCLCRYGLYQRFFERSLGASYDEQST